MINRAHGGLAKGVNIIDFSANINPLGLPRNAREAISKNMTAVTTYPETYSENLKKAIARFHNIKTDNLAVGNGSIELIYLIPAAFKTKRILITMPAFSEYEFAATARGVKPLFFSTKEEDNFRVRLADLGRRLPKNILIFLGNPNNPAGTCLDREELASFAHLCGRQNSVLAIDEAFMDFVDEREKAASLPLALNLRNVIVIRSLTKFFAMPGLRVGYCVAHCDIIGRISALQYPWNINSLAQLAAQEALKDKDYIDKTRNYIARERSRLYSGLCSINGLKVFPSSANFILCKLDGAAVRSAKGLNKILIKKDMAVRDCANFRGLNEKFFRVAVKDQYANNKLIKTLNEILA